MNPPQIPPQQQQLPQKLRTWPLMLIALAGLVSAISLILLIPQYFQNPLTQLQTSILQSQEALDTDLFNTSSSYNSNQNSVVGTPQSAIQISPQTESASFSHPPGVLKGVAKTVPSDVPLYKVTRVVDGDTIVVNINGQDEKIRLIGVNTPESVDPRKPVECFGLEASKYTKTLLENQSVILESDPTQGDTDKYGRLLRYVLLPGTSATINPTNINLKLIQDGYAHEYTYNKPYKYQKQFKQAQSDASSAQRGLWSTTACGAP
jgi:micrococcal nuclease